MKRILPVFISALLIAGVFAGCDNQAKEDPSQSTSQSQQSESGTPETKEQVNPQLEEYEAVLSPLAESGILFSSWTSVADIAPNSLVEFCAYSLDTQGAQQYAGSDGALTIPADAVENFLTEKFYGDSKVARESDYYSVDNNTYVVSPNLDKESNLKVVDVLHALTTYVTANKMLADGTSIIGRSSIEIDENLNGKLIVCLYEEGPQERETLSDNVSVNRFLQNLTNNATSQLFRVAGLIRDYGEEQPEISATAFTSAEELSANDLFHLYLIHFTRDNAAMNESFDDKDGFYHIPVKAITDFLDQYLEGYAFFPEDVSLDQSGYLEASGEILLSPTVGYDPGTSWYQATDAPVVENDRVVLTAACYRNGEAGPAAKPAAIARLTLKITFDGYRFVSLEIEPVSEGEEQAQSPAVQ